MSLQYRDVRYLGHVTRIEGRHFWASLTETGGQNVIEGEMSSALDPKEQQSRFAPQATVALTLRVWSLENLQRYCLIQISDPEKQDYIDKEAQLRAEKAVNCLYGLLRGLLLAQSLGPHALLALQNALSEFEGLLEFSVYRDLLTPLRQIIEAPLSLEALSDLFLRCKSALDDQPKLRYGIDASEKQELFSIFWGMTTVPLSRKSMEALQRWMQERPRLIATWPCQPLKQKIDRLLEQDEISGEDWAFYEKQLRAFSSYEPEPFTLRDLQRFAAYKPITLCDLDAQILIPEHLFCLTGDFLRGRERLEQEILKNGGQLVSEVDAQVHYVLRGDLGHPCYFDCLCGSKLVKARELQAQGVPIAVISESDFWDNGECSL